jgi:hypothetical protein
LWHAQRASPSSTSASPATGSLLRVVHSKVHGGLLRSDGETISGQSRKRLWVTSGDCVSTSETRVAGLHTRKKIRCAATSAHVGRLHSHQPRVSIGWHAGYHSGLCHCRLLGRSFLLGSFGRRFGRTSLDRGLHLLPQSIAQRRRRLPHWQVCISTRQAAKALIILLSVGCMSTV